MSFIKISRGHEHNQYGVSYHAQGLSIYLMYSPRSLNTPNLNCISVPVPRHDGAQRN